MAKDNNTHFLIYYSNLSGGIVVTTPLVWAHNNARHFGGVVPKLIVVEKYLRENFGFKKSMNAHSVIHYNFDSNILPNNQGVNFL